MIAIERILCPVDFSEPSRRALDHAAALARWYGAELTVAHVYSAVPVGVGMAEYPPAVLLEPPPLNELRDELARFAQPAIAAGIPTASVLLEGNVAPSILTKAQQLEADLLVLGTHGYGRVERLMLGSVTEKVLRKAHCPVLTVPPRATQGAHEDEGLFRRVLCPVDFSGPSMRALDYALSIAQEAGGRLTLLHVLEPPTVEGLREFAHYTVPEFRSHLEQQARERLRDAVPAAARSWCETEEVLAAGKPYREILRVASEQGSDLIVMGVHGRNVIDLALFGSTTNHVVHEAGCPVLTLRT